MNYSSESFNIIYYNYIDESILIPNLKYSVISFNVVIS